MFESTHETIKKNRHEFQIKQKKVQDSNHSVAIKPFSINDNVTIKSMRLQKKLQPKYNGIFKIAGITSHGNYILTNEKNETLKSGKTPPNFKIENHFLTKCGII